LGRDGNGYIIDFTKVDAPTWYYIKGKYH
jgi:hypothetical protein